MRKLLSTLLACILLASLTLGAGAAPAKLDGNGATLTLALRSGTYANVIKLCLPEFEKQYNVKTEVLELSEDDLHSKLALDATNKNGSYDLCMVDGSWMAEFAANGVLADLGALGYTLDDDIIPATTAISYADGKLYLAPYYGNVTVLLFNKELVKQAGYDGASIPLCQERDKKINDFFKKPGAAWLLSFLKR